MIHQNDRIVHWFVSRHMAVRPNPDPKIIGSIFSILRDWFLRGQLHFILDLRAQTLTERIGPSPYFIIDYQPDILTGICSVMKHAVNEFIRHYHMAGHVDGAKSTTVIYHSGHYCPFECGGVAVMLEHADPDQLSHDILEPCHCGKHWSYSVHKKNITGASIMDMLRRRDGADDLGLCPDRALP